MTLYNQKKCSFFIRKHVEESKKRGVLAENPPWSVLVAILYCPSEMTAPLGVRFVVQAYRVGSYESHKSRVVPLVITNTSRHVVTPLSHPHGTRQDLLLSRPPVS